MKQRHLKIVAAAVLQRTNEPKVVREMRGRKQLEKNKIKINCERLGTFSHTINTPTWLTSSDGTQEENKHTLVLKNGLCFRQVKTRSTAFAPVPASSIACT